MEIRKENGECHSADIKQEDEVDESCWNELMNVHHRVTCIRLMHCVCFVCVSVCIAVLWGAWPAGRGRSKVIVLKGIGGRLVRATSLIALGEGNVRWTNPKLLHSTPAHRGAEGRRGEGRKAGDREGRQESQTELLRVSRGIYIEQ